MDIALGVAQGIDDEILFEALHGFRESGAVFAQRVGLAALLHVRGQVIGTYGLLVADEDGALHGVPELADIARPLVAREEIHGRR